MEAFENEDALRDEVCRQCSDLHLDYRLVKEADNEFRLNISDRDHNILTARAIQIYSDLGGRFIGVSMLDGETIKAMGYIKLAAPNITLEPVPVTHKRISPMGYCSTCSSYHCKVYDAPAPQDEDAHMEAVAQHIIMRNAGF